MRDVAYRFYIADSLFVSGEGKRLTKRLADVLNPKPEDNRSAEEIAGDIISRFGLTVKDGENNG